MTVTIRNDDLPVFSIFLPVVYSDFVPGEPNDVCSSAFRVFPNVGYWLLPDDLVDWYWFDLPFTADLSIEITNFVPKRGWLVVYKGEQCVSLGDPLEAEFESSTTKSFELGQQTAGRYFITVTNDGPLSDTENYRLFVRAE
jgi:hypothetical protein